jgi:hypothetical protein
MPGAWKRIRKEFCYCWIDSSMWQCHCPCPKFLEHLWHSDHPCLEDGWYVQDGLLHNAGGRIVVPSNVGLCTEIIRLTHDVPHMGHPGIEKTIELIGQNYRWPSLRRDVADYMKTCLPCQQTKVFPSKVIGLLNLLPPSKEPWEQVTADFIVELPKSQGYDAVLVAADKHTKRVHFIPSVSSVSAEGSGWLFRDHVWKHHSWAKKIITN